jgi:hypothetical protein
VQIWLKPDPRVGRDWHLIARGCLSSLTVTRQVGQARPIATVPLLQQGRQLGQRPNDRHGAHDLSVSRRIGGCATESTHRHAPHADLQSARDVMGASHAPAAAGTAGWYGPATTTEAQSASSTR